VCLVLAGHPLDLIKVRMQTMQVAPGEEPPFRNSFDCIRKTFMREGVSAVLHQTCQALQLRGDTLQTRGNLCGCLDSRVVSRCLGSAAGSHADLRHVLLGIRGRQAARAIYE